MCGDAMEKERRHKERITYIERLPDRVLLHILSLLSTYKAVQTSILSKRWKNLWKSVPCLDLDCSYFNDDEAFQNFVNGVLILHKNKQLDRFCLTWFDCDKDGWHIIDTWMRHVIELRPRDLEVNAGGVNLLWFPSYLLSCVTLERLCLSMKISEGFKICPEMVNLPILKSLSLLELVINEGIMNGLISACPLLEELCLIGCSFQIPEIASLTLKDLTISDSYTKTLRIRAPNLVYLNCEAPLGLVSFESMPRLYEASIVLLNGGLGDEYDEKEIKLLHSLANAMELHLVGNDIKKMLEKELKNCCPFRNLKRLSFGGFCVSRDLQPIASFLHLTPNLEELTLGTITLCTSTGEEKAAEEIRCCHLKTIKIVGPEEEYDEYYKLVEVVWKNLETAEEPSVTIYGTSVYC